MFENRKSFPPYSPSRSNSRAAAVAIKGGESNPDSLPRIIASGRGKLAEQILELALARGVKVREDADLAELLVTLDLDTPIPGEAIVAVAEILAKVYEANANMMQTSLPGVTP